MDKWMQFCDGNREPILSDLKSHGYQSTLDLPMICFFDDIMKEFPDAKVLLTVRDSPKVWVKVITLEMIAQIRLHLSHSEILSGKFLFYHTTVGSMFYLGVPSAVNAKSEEIRSFMIFSFRPFVKKWVRDGPFKSGYSGPPVKPWWLTQDGLRGIQSQKRK